MAKTESQSLALGQQTSDFELFEPLTGKMRTLHDLQGDKGTVVMFMCNHCPYVIHIIEHLVNTAQSYQTQGIQFIAINSNDTLLYPDDSPENMTALANRYGFTFPYLFDETQNVAKTYQAACTPEIYLLDHELKLYYHGQYDNSRPGLDIALTGEDLIQAMDKLIQQQPAPQPQKPAMGCNIKWKQEAQS